MMLRVEEIVVNQLEGLRPAVKSEWEKLLRTEPTLSPLGNPDTLVYLMDETISDVIKGLRAHPPRYWQQHATALRRPLQRHCACGMNPLLNYYATGELALHAACAAALGPQLEDVLVCYHLIAQKEIDTLCAVCQHRCPSDCDHPRTLSV